MADVAQPQPMLSGMANRMWWALLLRGIAAVLFGLAALFWPNETLWVLVVIFGAYALVGGVFAIAAGSALPYLADRPLRPDLRGGVHRPRLQGQGPRREQ